MPYGVIMAGGAGTRLWPAARQSNPKQLQRLIYEEPIIAVTAKRLQPTFPLEHVFIVTTARYADPIRRTLPELPPQNVIAEPFGRNTAAAIALAAFQIARQDPEEVFAVFPADHVVLHPDKLLQAVQFSVDLARTHRVVDIGVPPSHPETGYGYIELGNELEQKDGLTSYVVKRFVEKPSLDKAQSYLQAGNYMWNSGMFVWQAKKFVGALEEYLPETYNALHNAHSEQELQAAYEHIPEISVDYAIMEKVSDVVAVPADFGWRDVGDWNALYDLMPKDEHQNAFEGQHVTLDTRNSLLLAPDKLIAAVGVEDLVVVDTPDVLLVMRRDRAQDVKKILDQLKERGEDQYL